MAEGVNTCRSVYDMAREGGVDMPIVSEVARILFEGKPPGKVPMPSCAAPRDPNPVRRIRRPIPE